MYRKIRCDVRQWKILETFRETKHSPYSFVPDVVRLVQDELATHVHTAYH